MLVTRAPMLGIGSLRYCGIPVAISSSTMTGAGQSPDVVLGNALLRQLRFTIDYGNGMWYFSPSQRFGERAPYFNTGINFDRQANGKLRATGVQAESVAARAGIRAGDAVLAINGDPTPNMDGGDIARAARPGDIAYRIQRNGRTFVVHLQLRDALPTCRKP